MVRKRDPFWSYAEELKDEKKFICVFCKKIYAGGISRIKSHLSRIVGRDIAPCTLVTDDVQVAAVITIGDDDHLSKRNKIGPQNVVQIITDNASNYGSAGELLMERYPHIYKTNCAPHGVQLLLKDIYDIVLWVKESFDNAKSIVDFMYKRSSVTYLLRKFTGDKDLKKISKTRFACYFLMLQSILELEDELQNLVASNSWRSMPRFNDNKAAQNVTGLIQGVEFWKEGKEVLSSLEPLIKVLRLADGEGSTSCYLYEAMMRAREELNKRCSNDYMKYCRILELFDKRRDENITSNVHAVAAFRNPYFMHNGKITNGGV